MGRVAASVLPLKICFTLLLMGSIPMWIRLVPASSTVIALARLSLGLGLTLLFFRKSIRWRTLTLRDGAFSRAARFRFLALGVCFGIHWLTYFESIQRSSATLGILALSTYGIHVTWMGAMFSEQRPGPREWTAVAFSAVGAWLCLPQADTDHGAFWGFLLGLLSALFYAALPLLHQRQSEINLPTRGAGQFGYAWLLFLPFAPSQSWQLEASGWLVLAILGVLCTFVAHNLWISITTAVRPATSGLLYYLAIPVTIFLEIFVLGEEAQKNQLLGALLIICGNGAVLLKKRAQSR